MRFLSSQVIPITRPFAPHLVVLEEDGNACTSHMEFLKLYFSFQWTFNSFETLPRKTLHLALPRPKFGNPITQPAPEAGFFIGKHHLWCGRGSLIERDRNSTWRQGSQSAKKKAQRAFSGCEELESLWGEPTDRVLAASLCHSRDRPANKCHCDSGVTNMIQWGEKLTWWKQGHTHVDLSEPLPWRGFLFVHWSEPVSVQIFSARWMAQWQTRKAWWSKSSQNIVLTARRLASRRQRWCSRLTWVTWRASQWNNSKRNCDVNR